MASVNFWLVELLRMSLQSSSLFPYCLQTCHPCITKHLKYVFLSPVILKVHQVQSSFSIVVLFPDPIRALHCVHINALLISCGKD